MKKNGRLRRFVWRSWKHIINDFNGSKERGYSKIGIFGLNLKDDRKK